MALLPPATIFCNNCGLRGHPFRECPDPILSCGILLLRNRQAQATPATLPIDVNDLEVLMVRRKDSMSYTEFIRGKYDPLNMAYVTMLLENMTQVEIARLQSEPFETLWVRLWNSIEKFESEFKRAQEKFDSVRAIVASVYTIYTEPEWGFPKGRRLKCESDQGCAEREFFEETNIRRSSYLMVSGVQLEETFNGTNSIPYQHKYFVALLTRPGEFDIHQRFSSMQRREISAIGWKTLSDCMLLTRPQYTQRKTLLEQLSTIAQTFEVRLPRQ
jgi:8-oxo-dGTP pyrophosphatase MutT (NUDIX family)